MIDARKAEEAKYAKAPTKKTDTINTKNNTFSRLDDLKEDPDEMQKDMINENFENTKLFSILEEAYALLVDIEMHGKNAKKQIV